MLREPASVGSATPRRGYPSPLAADIAAPRSDRRAAVVSRYYSAALAATAAGVVTLALYLMPRFGLHRPLITNGYGAHVPYCYVLLVIAAAAGQLVPRVYRLWVMIAASAAIAVLLVGTWAILLLGYVAVVIGISRLPVRLRAQLVLALGLWAAFPLARWTFLDGSHQSAVFYLAVLWAALLYSTLFVLVERARQQGAPATIAEDVFYIVAPPRLVTPFFQPVSRSRVLTSRREGMTLREAADAVGLGLLGGLYLSIAAYLSRADYAQTMGLAALPLEYVKYYGRAAGGIFIAIGLMRCLGFALPAGFDRPLLSTSFVEFFRRWNWYVREAVMSLFFYPLLGVLRRHLPPRAAVIVAAYAAILVGSFLLNDLLVPLTTNAAPDMALALQKPARLLVLVVFWSAIILPQALGLWRRIGRRPCARQVAVGTFLALYFGLWTLAGYLGTVL